jgi:hypothetical protein
MPRHLIGRLLDERDEQFLFGADVVVQRGAIDADLDGDVFEPGPGEALATEDFRGAFQDGLPPLVGRAAVGVAPLVAATSVVALGTGGWNRRPPQV